MQRPTGSNQRVPIRRAFSLVEVTIASLLVALILAGAMQGVGLAVASSRNAADAARASALADDLLTEILSHPIVDPVGGAPATPGPGPGEDDTGTRSEFNDIDDYHGWSASPPQERNGSKMDGLADWTRAVSVYWVDPSNMSNASSYQGIVRVVVSVSRGGRMLAEREAFRTQTWQEALE